MSDIEQFGFFREFRSGFDASISEALGGDQDGKKNEVIAYLKSGSVYIAVPGWVVDSLQSKREKIGPAHYLSDGEWIWPYELAYLVDKYGVQVPSAFYLHMESRNWQAPELTHADLLELERRHLGN